MDTATRRYLSQKWLMNDKTEWELVDGPTTPGARPTLRDVLKAVLGRHWLWKTTGIAVVGGLILALLFTLTGVMLLLMVAGALLSMSIGKLRRWLGRDRRSVVRQWR
jgi:hypothetical protein